MSFEEYIVFEQNKLRQLLEDQQPLFLASQSALVDISTRVFVKGQDVSGAKFSYNDNKPIYVNPDTSPGIAFKPAGKPKEVTKKGVTKSVQSKKKFVRNNFTGRKVEGTRKTRWFPSYKDYREEIGRESGFVNFELSGDLKSDIENRANGDLTPRKSSPEEYIITPTRKENIKKVEGFNDKYPGVFAISENEKGVFRRIFNEEMLRNIREGRP